MVYNITLVKKEYQEVLVEANSEEEAREFIKNHESREWQNINDISIAISEEELKSIEDWISSNDYTSYDVENLKVSANGWYYGCGDYCVLNTKFGGCPFKDTGWCSSKTIQKALENIGVDYKDSPSYHYINLVEDNK
jgi:hypothetical protein